MMPGEVPYQGPQQEGTDVPPVVTVNGSQPSTWMQRMWFKAALFLQTWRWPVYRKVLYAQAKLETGSFSSYGFAKRKNPFGMRPAVVRPNSQSGEHGGFATYASYWKAVRDRIQWDEYNGIPPADKFGSLTSADGATRTPAQGYIDEVIDYHYVTPTEAPGYRSSWIGLYGADENEGMGMVKTIFTILILGVTLTVLWKLYKFISGRSTANPWRRTWKRSRRVS